MVSSQQDVYAICGTLSRPLPYQQTVYHQGMKAIYFENRQQDAIQSRKMMKRLVMFITNKSLIPWNDQSIERKKTSNRKGCI